MDQIISKGLREGLVAMRTVKLEPKNGSDLAAEYARSFCRGRCRGPVVPQETLMAELTETFNDIRTAPVGPAPAAGRFGELCYPHHLNMCACIMPMTACHLAPLFVHQPSCRMRRWGGRACTSPLKAYDAPSVDRVYWGLTWACTEDAGMSSDPAAAGMHLPYTDSQTYAFLGRDGHPVKAFKYTAWLAWASSPNFPASPAPFLTADALSWHDGLVNESAGRDTLMPPSGLDEKIKCTTHRSPFLTPVPPPPPHPSTLHPRAGQPRSKGSVRSSRRARLSAS